MKNKRYLPFYLLTIGVLVALVLPRLMQDGMFTDGVLYAAVAHNLANGMGTFWHPYFDKTMFSFFHQQPPLTFGIQALFFKVFGGSMYVERFYSFLTLLISAWLINLIWKQVYHDNERMKKMSWLPVVFWIIIPVCLWSYSNNMEENTMGVFTLLSVLYAIKGLKAGRLRILFLIISSVCVSLAFLCKGFPGMFALGIPLVYWLCMRPYSFAKMLGYSALMIATVGCIYGMLLLNPIPRESLFAYMNDRVLHSILKVSTQDSRVYLLIKLFFVELLTPAALCLVIGLLLKWKRLFNTQQTQKNKGTILLFFLIGISASLPLIITREQREFYLVPSLPYYAIALSMIVGDGLAEWIERIKIQAKSFKLFRVLTIAFIAGGIAYSLSLIGTTGRNKEQLHDVYMLGKIIPNGTTILVFHETWDDWALHNYFVRYFNIGMSYDTSVRCKYFLLERDLNKLPPPGYSKMALNTEEYDLYKNDL